MNENYSTMQAYQTLVSMIDAEKSRGHLRSVFLPKDSDNFKAAFAVGEKIHALGEKTTNDSGFNLMRWMFDELDIGAENLQPGDLKELSIVWNGIGEWRD